MKYDAGDSWVGARMRPDKGFVLWKNGIRGAANQVVRGEDALALLPELATIGKQNLSETALVQVVDIITKPMLGRRQDQRLIHALDTIHLTGGCLRIKNLAHSVGCSLRHLNRMFQSNIGLSAKTYSQLVQFHRALKLIKNEGLPITSAAIEGGYTDHAHLTRAFRRFGGFTPIGIPTDLTVPVLFT